MSLWLAPSVPARARSRVFAEAIICLFAIVRPGDVSGQMGSFEVNAGLSYSLPPSSVAATETPYFNLGAGLLAPIGLNGTWFLAGAAGLSLVSDGASWISAATGANWSFVIADPLYLDLGAGAEVFSVGEPYPYQAVQVEGEPVARLELGATTVRLVGWGGVGRSLVQPVQGSQGGTGGPMGGMGREPKVDTDLWSWGGRLEAYHRIAGTEPRAGVEAYASAQGSYLGGRVGIRYGVLDTLWDLDFGWWDTPTGADVRFSASVIVPVGPDVSVRAFGGRYGPDPLLDTPVAGSAGAAVSWTVSRFSGTSPEVYEIVQGPRPLVRFRLDAGDASVVVVVGDFTEWEQVPMVRQGEVWETELEIEPGVYQFGFRVDDEWYVPSDAFGFTIGEWGIPQATLVVPVS